MKIKGSVEKNNNIWTLQFDELFDVKTFQSWYKMQEIAAIFYVKLLYFLFL